MTTEVAVGQPVLDLPSGAADAAGVVPDDAGDLEVLELVHDRGRGGPEEPGQLHGAAPAAVEEPDDPVGQGIAQDPAELRRTTRARIIHRLHR